MEYEGVIPWPAGLVKSENYWEPFVVYRTSLTCPNWRWMFRLAPDIQLNMTVNFVYFSAIELDPCASGEFQIRIIHPQHYNTSTTSCGLEWAGTYAKQCPELYAHPGTLRMCGVHSLSHVLIPYAITYLAGFVEYSVFYEIDFSYTLMNALDIHTVEQQITSYHCPTRDAEYLIKTVNSVAFKKKDMSLHVYHITTWKTQRIGIKKSTTNEHDFWIHNGPGTFSERLLPTRQTRHGDFIYLTATFQCVLYVYGNSKQKQNIMFVHFSVHISSIHQMMLSPFQTYSGVYPEISICQHSVICMILVETNPAFL